MRAHTRSAVRRTVVWSAAVGASAAIVLFAALPASAATNPTVTVAVGSDPGSISATADGSTVYVGNVGDDTVSEIDVATGSVSATLDASQSNAQYHKPVALAVAPDGSALFNVLDRGFSKLNLSTSEYTPIAGGPTLAVGVRRVAVSVDGASVYMPNAGFNSVLVVDAATFQPSGFFPVASPHSIAVTADKAKILVVSNATDLLTVLSSDGTVLGTVALPTGAEDVAVSPDGATAYATSSSGVVSVIDLASFTVSATIPLAGASGVATSPNGRTVYVTSSTDATLSSIDVATNTVTGSYAVGNGASGLTLSANGWTGFVSNTTDDTVSIVDLRIAPTVETVGLPSLTAGSPFTFTVVATGFPAPTFTVTGGTLPAGLTLDPATGIISGSPTAGGAYTFTVTATNGVGSASVTYSGTIAAGVTALAATGFDVAGGSAVALLLLGAGLAAAAASAGPSRRRARR